MPGAAGDPGVNGFNGFNGGAGTAGGGSIMLRTYSDTGSILINGGGINASGQDGNTLNVPGGGGGAGGSIVLLSPTVTLFGATLTADGASADGVGGGAGKIVLAADNIIEQTNNLEATGNSGLLYPGGGLGFGGAGGAGGNGGAGGAFGNGGAAGLGGGGRTNKNYSLGGIGGAGGASGTNGIGGQPGSCDLFQAIINYINEFSSWSFWDSSTYPGTNWQQPGFADSAWTTGLPVFGYGNGDEQTMLNASNGAISVYFRQHFVATNAAELTNLLIMLRRQDGAVVYLNGIEVLRDNMPGGVITPTTYAPGDAPDGGKQVIFDTISPEFLLPGSNLMAVEVHRSATNTNALTFALELVGNLSLPSYMQTFVPGYTAFTPQLQNGATPPTLDSLIPTAPGGTTVSIWTPLGVRTETYHNNTAWLPGTNTLAVGEGAILYNPSTESFSITIAGTPPYPLPTYTLMPSIPALIGSTLPGAADFEQIVGSPPADGTVLEQLVAGPGGSNGPIYLPYQFSNGVWEPSEPVANLGEAVQITLPCLSLSWPSNEIVEAQSAQGDLASNVVMAQDFCMSSFSLTYTPSNGSWLPLGTNEISVVAVDEGGNSATANFTVTVVDTTPPAILYPSNFVVEATSPAGAIINFTNVSATDLVDPAPQLVCEPPSGSVFPFGLSYVQCTAWDAAGNSNQVVFPVTVVDTQPPVITCPGTTTVLQTMPEGAALFYTVQVSDVADPNVQVSYSAPPGSIIAPGISTISCTATDFSGNSAECSFVVLVEAPSPFMISGIDYNPNQVVVAFPTQVGVQYQVEYTDSITEPVWLPLSTVVGNTNSMQVIDFNPASARRFYRVQAP
jgi:hypothetical protein